MEGKLVAVVAAATAAGFFPFFLPSRYVIGASESVKEASLHRSLTQAAGLGLAYGVIVSFYTGELAPLVFVAAVVGILSWSYLEAIDE